MSDSSLNVNTERIRDEIRSGTNVDTRFGPSLNSGTYFAQIWHHDYVAPVANAWYRFTQNASVIDLANIYVVETFRRCGLMTKLLKDIVAAYPDVKQVVTDGGTMDGLAFMIAAGFKELPGGTGWGINAESLRS